MDDMTRFEDGFEERLRAFAMTGVQSVDSAAVARTVAAGHPRSAATRPARRRLLDEIYRTRQRSMSRTTFAAAAIVALVALGGAFAAFGGPSPMPSTNPSASLPGVVAPSSTPSKPGPSAEPTSSAVTSTTGVWIATGTMVTPRNGHTTAVRLPDGRVLVAGGADDENDTSAELYDPNGGTWSATGNMVHPYAGFPATLLRNGKVLVGDDDNRSDPSSGAELYDPATGTWSSTGRLVITEEWLGGTTATLLANGRVLVTGFHGSELYDPDSGNWTAISGKMVTPRYNHTATLLPDGRVLVSGGDVPPDHATDSAELYDPDTGSWTATANLRATGNTRADTITATLLQDGTVLVVRPSTAELYDPLTGTWAATGELPSPATAYRSATLLSDGMVLVPLSDADAATPGSTATGLYDPGTGSWTTVAPMLWSHRTPAILLLDGTVLVAGSDDCLDRDCITTGSAELYVPRGVSPPTLPAIPSPTPRPIPTPTPTPLPPQAGPVPPGARTWTVKVVNESSKPATLFMAEEGESGVARLCGNVTPNVVQAGVTVKVTFLLPPKRVTSCWIWVNPGPGGGGSFFQTSDAPMDGEFFIQEGGQAGWISRGS